MKAVRHKPRQIEAPFFILEHLSKKYPLVLSNKHQVAYFKNIADWAFEKTGAAWNDGHKIDLQKQHGTVFVISAARRKNLSNEFDLLRKGFNSELNHLANPPNMAKVFLEVYNSEGFDSAQHRLVYLESCLKHVAGCIFEDDNRPFPWPSTFVSPLTQQMISVAADHFELSGMLSHFGYHVGAAGLTESKRRERLKHLFLYATLPVLNSPEYTAKWGGLNTGKRLRQIAESMAFFCRNAKKRAGADMTQSIMHWESDLAWLRTCFYEGRFSFPWPKLK